LQQGTDILGALGYSGKYYEDDQENIIIFLSDMMNWSGNLKMEEGHFDGSMVDKKLNETPNVEGKSAKVIVITGDITNISSKHFEVVSDFWNKYFKKNNFILVDYTSAGKAKLEELMLTRE
jgi:hypothetical protein